MVPMPGYASEQKTDIRKTYMLQCSIYAIFCRPTDAPDEQPYRIVNLNYLDTNSQ
jgi:hypothetical protein